MPSRRDQIKLDEAEQAQLLDEERVAVVTSNGQTGWPHSMPMWFTPRDRVVWIWTFAKSQKVRNLERDPRATLLIEAGFEYGELRGLMIESEAVIHREPEVIAEFGKEMAVRYSGNAGGLDDDASAVIEAQAAKRVAISFPPTRVRSWDHRKLAGTY